MDIAADVNTPELDQLQAHYQTLVADWIAAIQQEAALAAAPHSVEDIDAWEAAYFRQDALRGKVKLAKAAYENGLRAKFYQF